MRISISFSAILAPICWSPPSGPLWSLLISIPSDSSNSLPVVPVAYRSCSARRDLLNFAHSNKSRFLSSCATRAIFFLYTIIILLYSFQYKQVSNLIMSILYFSLRVFSPLARRCGEIAQGILAPAPIPAASCHPQGQVGLQQHQPLEPLQPA